MDSQILIKYLDDPDTRRVGWDKGYIDTDFETMPSEFIDFAENDLQSTFEHKYINALSNAKRALDCQADRLLKLFGCYKEAQSKFLGFPKKLEIIQSFEIIAPRVLNKINKTRNLMEHQYIKPKADQVEDFLDIVSLFIASTDHYTTNFTSEIHYLNTVNKEFDDCYSEVQINYDAVNSVLSIKTVKFKPDEKDIEFKIKKTDSEYFEVLKRHVKKYKLCKCILVTPSTREDVR